MFVIYIIYIYLKIFFNYESMIHYKTIILIYIWMTYGRFMLFYSDITALTSKDKK